MVRIKILFLSFTLPQLSNIYIYIHMNIETREGAIPILPFSFLSLWIGLILSIPFACKITNMLLV